MKKKSPFARQIPVPIKQKEVEPEISEAHKALLQWEANVESSKFEYDYIYNYPEGHEYAVVAIKLPEELKGNEAIVQFTNMRMFPYRLLWNGTEVFIADKLREINTWLNKKQKENENTSELETI